MKCAVITPVGPGHKELAKEALGSVTQASIASQGPFSVVSHILVDDTKGELGRSEARNWAVKQAHRVGFEWVFFLDADDLMLPSAFESVKDYMELDAIWGTIFDVSPGEDRALPRDQVSVHSLKDLLDNDPYQTLQMGHFVRSEIALDNPFDITMDAGEDFDCYVRLWKNHKCDKIDDVLFVNRRGLHSEGPRSAHGGIWRRNVQRIIANNKRIIH